MILQFIHLILLCYICCDFAGYYAQMPHAAAAIWLTLSFITLYFLLPNHTEKTVKSSRIPPFFKTYNIYCFIIVIWVGFFFVFVNPLSALANTCLAKSTSLTIFIAMVLYLLFIKPFMSSLYEMLKPVLPEDETQNDFIRARLTAPIIFFPPVIIWLIFEDLGINEGMELMSEIKTLTVAPLFLFALYFLSPRLFNWAWKTQDASPELIERIKELSNKAQAKIAGVKIWNTFKEPLPNAAVAGLISKFRFVYITDYLLKIFNEEQLEAVVGHELGHLRLGHVTTYLLFSINAILMAIIVKSIIILYFPYFYVHSTLSYVLETVIFVPVFAVTFTALARHCERQADIFSSIIAKKESFISSMYIMKAMLGSKPKWLPKWLLTHPEAEDRIENVEKTYVSQIDSLIKPSNNLRISFFALAILLLVLAVNPVSTLFKFSDIYDASQLGDYKQVTTLSDSLPEDLQKHPFVLEQKFRAAFYDEKYVLAVVVSLKAYYGIDLESNYYLKNQIKDLVEHQ